MGSFKNRIWIFVVGGAAAIACANSTALAVVALPGTPTVGTPITNVPSFTGVIAEGPQPQQETLITFITPFVPGETNVFVTEGYVVLVEGPTFSDHSPSNWSDVIQFSNQGEQGAAAIMNSDTEGAPFDAVLIAAALAGNTVYLPETTDPVFYTPGVAKYELDSDVEVPEPATLGILAIAGMGMLLRRRISF